MVLEVLPPVDATKGTAVRHLLDETGLRRALYAGDDTTDLDGFAALDGLRGVRPDRGRLERRPVGARRARRRGRRLDGRLPRPLEAALEAGARSRAARAAVAPGAAPRRARSSARRRAAGAAARARCGARPQPCSG